MITRILTTDEWMVQEYMIDNDEGQSTFMLSFDLTSNKSAYIAGFDGDRGYDDEYAKKNMANPKWKDYNTQWDKNTARWLKDGRPLNVDYCN